MSRLEIQTLTRQCQKLRSRVNYQQTEIECLKKDRQTFEQLVISSKKDNDRLYRDLESIKSKAQTQSFQKEDTNSRYLNVLKKLQDQLQNQKRKYQKLEKRIAPLVDHDLVRLKVLTEVQYAHQVQLDKLKRQNQGLRDQVLKSKRQIEALKHQLETTKLDQKEEIRTMKVEAQNKKDRGHLETLACEAWQESERSLKKNYEEARREAEYYRNRYFQAEKKYQERVRLLENQINQQTY